MALPSVNVSLTEDNFVIKEGEPQGEFLCGIVVENMDIINATGLTKEVSDKFMEVNSLSDWWGRLSLITRNGSGIEFDGLSGGTGRWPNGATGTWKDAWWAIETYLEYGGKAVVGVSGSSPFNSLNTHNLNAIFGVTTGVESDFGTILTNRQKDCVALFNIESKESPSTPSGADGNRIYIYGSQFVLPAGTDPNTITNDDDYIEVPLVAGVAGCLARTQRVAAPWYSPAGLNRGTILNANLKDPPTAQEAITLSDNRINSVLGFPGRDPALFGNKTGSPTGSVDDTIEKTMLILYIKRTIGEFANSTLFEQNNFTTRQVFSNQASAVLEDIKAQNGITEYRIVCDESNNPQSSVIQGKFNAELYIKTVASVEEIKISFNNYDEQTDIN